MSDHLTERITRLRALLMVTIDRPTRTAIGQELAALQAGLIGRNEAA
jgi:hypothetical protein